jgi:hypothetical protein
MVDFGLLVARFSTATPNIATDNVLRELRIDSGGRVHSRLTDDRDMSLRYFLDGEAVTGGNTDRGIVMLGLNATDSNYQMFRVNDDGSLSVSFNSGTDASEAADKANAADGEIALSSGNWVLIQSKALASGKMHVSGWSFGSDKNTVFQLALAEAAAAPVRADITEILDTQIATSARPSDHVSFERSLDRNGGANVKLCVFAKQVQSGGNGVAFSMMNYYTTT